MAWIRTVTGLSLMQYSRGCWRSACNSNVSGMWLLLPHVLPYLGCSPHPCGPRWLMATPLLLPSGRREERQWREPTFPVKDMTWNLETFILFLSHWPEPNYMVTLTCEMAWGMSSLAGWPCDEQKLLSQLIKGRINIGGTQQTRPHLLSRVRRK